MKFLHIFKHYNSHDIADMATCIEVQTEGAYEIAVLHNNKRAKFVVNSTWHIRGQRQLDKKFLILVEAEFVIKQKIIMHSSISTCTILCMLRDISI